MTERQIVAEELGPLIGADRDLHTVYYALKQAARRMRAGEVGAMHITCSDEAELETIESFHASFARDLLPRLKFSHRSPFATSNLGGQYEWGSLAVAEEHFATPLSGLSFKLMVVKVSSHVAVESRRGEIRFGTLRRYDTDSSCCGLLTELLAGTSLPSAEPLSELLQSEGIDRLSMLRHEVEPRYRMLVAAIVAARLQARSAVLEAQEHRVRTPTLYLVVPTVTLNKPDRDGELICGAYLIDRRQGRGDDSYLGLGDVPTAYAVVETHGRLAVTEDGSSTARPARDHRRALREARLEHAGPLARDGRVDEILARAKSEALQDHGLNVLLLEGLLLALAELSPVSAALLLFGEGTVGIYNAYRAHRLVSDVEASAEGREILEDLHRHIERMPPEEVEKVLRVLLAEYEGQD